MANEKYQIFISSTYNDLIKEREQIVKATLEMGHIPVGMEMFSAADEEQWEIIARQIDQSDYYVVILAHRYGSLAGDISYTEKEYDYAVKQGVPTLGFVIDDKASWPSDRVDKGKTLSKLTAFKEKVKLKPVAFWSTKDDLHNKCVTALVKSFNTRPRPGWIRAPEGSSLDVATEVSRLSSENARLREELAVLKKDADTSNLVQGDDELTLLFKSPGVQTEFALSTTWNKIFLIVASAVIDDPSEDYIRASIRKALASEVNVLYSINGNSATYTKNSLAMIKRQFIALGFIQIEFINSDKPTNAFFSEDSGLMPIWKLTSLGERTYANLAAMRRD